MARAPLLLSLLGVALSEKYSCSPFAFSSGEAELRLQGGPTGSVLRFSFIDIKVPISGLRGRSGDSNELFDDLQDQFFSVCSEGLRKLAASNQNNGDSLWGANECTDDLFSQLLVAVSNECPANAQNPGIGENARNSLNDALRKHHGETPSASKHIDVSAEHDWQQIEAEVLKLAAVLKADSASRVEEEDHTGVGFTGSTATCDALRRFTHLFMGQSAPALHVIASEIPRNASVYAPPAASTTPSSSSSSSPLQPPLYSKAKRLLEGPNGVGLLLQASPPSGPPHAFEREAQATQRSGRSKTSGVQAWRDLARFALSNLEHTVGAGRWDERAFPEVAAAAAEEIALTVASSPSSSSTRAETAEEGGEGALTGSPGLGGGLDAGWDFESSTVRLMLGDVVARRELSDARAVQWLLQVFWGSESAEKEEGEGPLLRSSSSSSASGLFTVPQMRALERNQQWPPPPPPSAAAASSSSASSSSSSSATSPWAMGEECEDGEDGIVWVLTVASSDDENDDDEDVDGDDDEWAGQSRDKKLAALVSSAEAAGPCVKLQVLSPPHSERRERRRRRRRRAQEEKSGVGAAERGEARRKEKAKKKKAVLGEEGAWANDWKPRLLRKHLRAWPRERMVLFVDGYDVLLSPETSQLRQRLAAANLTADVVFAAERDCWPDAALCRWLQRPPYLNAGVFAGKAGRIADMLEDMHEWYGDFGFCGEDQRAYQRFLLDAGSSHTFTPINLSGEQPTHRPPRVQLDEASAVFQCMHGYSWHVEIEVLPTTTSRRLDRRLPSSQSAALSRQHHGQHHHGGVPGSGVGSGSSAIDGSETQIAVPILYEVQDGDNGRGGDQPGGRRQRRRPLVMHFNSHDGKEMMRTVVEAMDQSITAAAFNN